MSDSISIYYTHAQTALEQLRAAGVPPTPTFYEVIYTALSRTVPELSDAYQQMMGQKIPLTVERLDYLHATYLADKHDELVKQSALTARKLLADILGSVQQYSGAAGKMSGEIHANVDTLNADITEAELRILAESILHSTQTLKISGDVLNQKLEASQKEISDLRENLAKVTSESEYDFLTNVYNRKAFDMRLSERMTEASEDKTELALLMIDVDHFKLFNDKFGHLIGDEVLKIVARSLTDTVKGMDTVARYGGEEFAVILPKTPIGGGMIVAEAIRRTIAGRELKRRGTGENYGAVTVSIGVAALRHDSDTMEMLIKRADEALYRSKKSGRNRVTQENLSG